MQLKSSICAQLSFPWVKKKKKSSGMKVCHDEHVSDYYGAEIAFISQKLQSARVVPEYEWSTAVA